MSSYRPDLLCPWFTLPSAVLKQEILSPREKELTILVVAAVYDATYVLYAHRLLAKEVGLEEAQIDCASRGEVPSELMIEAEVVVYEIALKLAGGRRFLDQGGWERALRVLGRERTVRFAYLVSGYMYACILLNVGAVGAPEAFQCGELATETSIRTDIAQALLVIVSFNTLVGDRLAQVSERIFAQNLE